MIDMCFKVSAIKIIKVEWSELKVDSMQVENQKTTLRMWNIEQQKMRGHRETNIPLCSMRRSVPIAFCSKKTNCFRISNELCLPPRKVPRCFGDGKGYLPRPTFSKPSFRELPGSTVFMFLVRNVSVTLHLNMFTKICFNCC